jgi:hypothetical protein
VCDEEKSVARKLTPDPRVIDGRHDRLSGSSRSNEEVAVVALVTCERDVLEEGLLERAQFDHNGAESELRRQGGLRSFREFVSVVDDEVVACPIAFEDRLHLCDRVRVADAREPDVPLQSGDLG